MNATVQNLINRKSCKSYTDKHVDKDMLKQIAEAGLNAPSGMNRQTPIIVAVSDDETVKKLSSMNAGVMGMSADPFYGAKDVMIVLAKKEGTYLYDGSLAMGNMLNAAYSLGLGCCWIHRAKEVFESEGGKALLAEWGISDDVEGIGFCTVGHVKEEKAKTVIKDGRVFYI